MKHRDLKHFSSKLRLFFPFPSNASKIEIGTLKFDVRKLTLLHFVFSGRFFKEEK